MGHPETGGREYKKKNTNLKVRYVIYYLLLEVRIISAQTPWD
jgi:hypothetical protein